MAEKKKIILSADSTCDMPVELREKLDLHLFPLHVIIGDKQYTDDGIDITGQDIFRIYREKKLLPTTSAISVGEYVDYFKQFLDKGYEVIHINIGTGVSACHQNACIAASDLGGGIYPVNSKSLSAGSALIVLEAYDRIQEGKSAAQIQQELIPLTDNVRVSFVVDTLEFLRKGGRCSALEAFGANLLKLHPSIDLDNANGGAMTVGKKYRGSMEKVYVQFLKDKFALYKNIKRAVFFIAHAVFEDESYLPLIIKTAKELYDFDKIYDAPVSAVVNSHCGPNTYGLILMLE
ncbi:MAG: DegV family protein [Oscillospiraceae bacterium]|nr:DegV family protein [Oscillospiraceae bacterium]